LIADGRCGGVSKFHFFKTVSSGAALICRMAGVASERSDPDWQGRSMVLALRAYGP
jgi:hypothetical protein